MLTPEIQKTSDGNDCFFRNDTVTVLRLASRNVVRFPEHNYPVLCFRISTTSRVTNLADGTIEFCPTADEIKALFEAVQHVHPSFGVVIKPGKNKAVDPRGCSPDQQFSVLEQADGFTLRVRPVANTRTRRLIDNTVEIMPRTSELHLLAALHNRLSPQCSVSILGKTENKPESRRLRWVAINSYRANRRNRTSSSRRRH